MALRRWRFAGSSSSRRTRTGDRFTEELSWLSGGSAIGLSSDAKMQCPVTFGWLFRCRLQVSQKFRKAVEERDGTQPLTIVDCGIAADDLSRFYIAGDSGLRGGDGTVAYGAVSSDANLTGENDAFTHGRGAGKTHLGA